MHYTCEPSIICNNMITRQKINDDFFCNYLSYLLLSFLCTIPVISKTVFKQILCIKDVFDSVYVIDWWMWLSIQLNSLLILLLSIIKYLYFVPHILLNINLIGILYIFLTQIYFCLPEIIKRNVSERFLSTLSPFEFFCIFIRRNVTFDKNKDIKVHLNLKIWHL